MKSKVSILLICSSLLLNGCALFPFINNNSSNSNYSSFSSTNDSNHSENSNSSEEERLKTIDIYTINDFHGAVLEGRINGYQTAGLGKMMTYLKDKGDKPNTLLMDQGDTWQGSVFSNHNRGQMITDVNIENLSLELLKKYYGKAISLKKQDEYYNITQPTLYALFNSLNIKRMDTTYFNYTIKSSDKFKTIKSK